LGGTVKGFSLGADWSGPLLAAQNSGRDDSALLADTGNGASVAVFCHVARFFQAIDKDRRSILRLLRNSSR
jgi:hypothetical protein